MAETPRTSPLDRRLNIRAIGILTSLSRSRSVPMTYRHPVLIACAILLLALAAGLGVVAYFSCDSDYPYMEVAPGAVVPKLSLHKTIHLERGAGSIVAMAFSPNNRYVAIGYSQAVLSTSVKVWDLKRDKEQSHFVCPPKTDPLCLSTGGQLLWSKDNQTILLTNESTSHRTRFDAITGQVLPALPIQGRSGRLNRDGSRLLTRDGSILEGSYSINIYDTQNWSLQQLPVDGLSVVSAAWTYDDKILVGAQGNRQTIGKTIDGFTIAHHVDQAFRVLDPKGKEATKSIWFAAVPDTRPNHFPWMSSSTVLIRASDLTSGRVALDGARIIDTTTMTIFDYLSDEEKKSAKIGWFGGQVFSPDGKYLFTKDAGRFDNKRPVTNAIFDAATGKRLALFGGESGTNHEGIAISPDGTMLALGNVNSVQILKMKPQPSLSSGVER